MSNDEAKNASEELFLLRSTVARNEDESEGTKIKIKLQMKKYYLK